MDKLIEEYFRASTTPRRKAAIEKQLQESEEGRMLIELGTDVSNDAKVQYFKERVSKANNNRKNAYFKYAASAIIAVGVGLLLYMSLTKTTQSLYDKYYRPFDGYVVEREVSERHSEALMFYTEGDYRKALDAFLRSPANTALENLFIATCYLELGSPEKSIQILAQDKGSSGVLEASRKWYLAISYLKMGKEDRCKTIVNDLIHDDNVYQPRAQELFNEL